MFNIIINFIGRVAFILLCYHGGKLLWKKYKTRKEKKMRTPESTEVGKAYVDIVTLDDRTYTRKFLGKAHYSELDDTIWYTNVEDRVIKWIDDSSKRNIFSVSWEVSIPLHQVKIINVRYEDYSIEV